MGLKQRLNQVWEDIAETADRCGRSPSDITLVAVSKTFPVEQVEAAAQLGQKVFGENRVQEAREKVPLVSLPALSWHLIGHLQSNKVKQAVELFDFVETVDSEKLARRLDRICGELGKRMPVLIEVNVGREPQKSGVLPVEAEELAGRMQDLENVDLRGLMAIPPFAEHAEPSRKYFRELAGLLERINAHRSQPLRELSMGMSTDYRVAIQEGATIIRIGTAIFGDRH